MPNRWREILSDGSAVRLSFRTLLAGKVEVNEFEFLVFQLNLDSEVAHVLLDIFVAACSGLFAFCGGLILFLVKRKIRRDDEWRARIESDIAELKSAMGAASAARDRP